MTVALMRLLAGSAAVLASALAGVPLAARAPDPAVKEGVEAWARHDYATAVDRWRKPAKQGDADAQFNLGQAYKLGRGVPSDLKAAEDWYAKAAAQGHDQAADNYGLMLFQNDRKAQAMPWLEKSAARGEPRAQYYLGAALFNGDGIAKDWPRAYALMTRAAARGLAPATRALGEMDQNIPLDQRQQGKTLAAALERNTAKPKLTMASASSDRITRMPPMPQAAPAPTPVTRPAPPRAAEVQPAGTGGWRVQLGAFGDPTKARSLWGQLTPQVSALAGLTPHFVKAGAVTRLQAGPIATKSAADQLCRSVATTGNGCIAIRP